MKRQLICFIDHIKFYYFLGEGGKVAEGIKFPLNNPDCLGYVDSEGKPEFAEFDHGKAKQAAILIVPDSFDLLKAYTPEIKFKILYHSKTEKELRVDPLINLRDNCEGFEKSTESEFVDNITKSETTTYNDVRLFISNNQNGESKSFDEIYDKIRTTNIRLEVVLDFLHGCLSNSPDENTYSKLLKNGIVVSDNIKLNVKFEEETYLNELEKLRNELLKQVLQ